MALDKLVTDARTQVRAEISEYIVGEYVDALGEGARFPPVVVFRGKGADVLADGFHRLRAYQQAGRSEIEADVYQGDRDDALWFALGANRAHGQRLSGEDKRRAIEIAYKAWPEISQRRIAAHVGCNQGYVGRVRAQLNTRVQLPDRVVGSDGRERPATRPSTSRQRARAEDDAAPATQNQRPVDGSDSAEEADAQTRAASPNKGCRCAHAQLLPRTRSWTRSHLVLFFPSCPCPSSSSPFFVLPLVLLPVFVRRRPRAGFLVLRLAPPGFTAVRFRGPSSGLRVDFEQALGPWYAAGR